MLVALAGAVVGLLLGLTGVTGCTVQQAVPIALLAVVCAAALGAGEAGVS
jgi:hypothetical protein